MMKIEMNRAKKEIIVMEKDYKKACVYGTTEFEEYEEILARCEGYTVKIKKSTKTTYAKLTYEKMEGYIKTQANSEAMLIEFNAVRKIADAKAKGYPSVKSWFLKAYPEYKESKIKKEELLTEMELIEREEKEKAEKANKIVDIETAKAVNK